jgi:hypothetical protein
MVPRHQEKPRVDPQRRSSSARPLRRLHPGAARGSIPNAPTRLRHGPVDPPLKGRARAPPRPNPPSPLPPRGGQAGGGGFRSAAGHDAGAHGSPEAGSKGRGGIRPCTWRDQVHAERLQGLRTRGGEWRAPHNRRHSDRRRTSGCRRRLSATAPCRSLPRRGNSPTAASVEIQVEIFTILE